MINKRNIDGILIAHKSVCVFGGFGLLFGKQQQRKSINKHELMSTTALCVFPGCCHRFFIVILMDTLTPISSLWIGKQMLTATDGGLRACEKRTTTTAKSKEDDGNEVIFFCLDEFNVSYGLWVLVKYRAYVNLGSQNLTPFEMFHWFSKANHLEISFEFLRNTVSSASN